MAEEDQPEKDGGKPPAPQSVPRQRPRLRLRGHVVVESDDELIVADRPADPPPVAAPNSPSADTSSASSA